MPNLLRVSVSVVPDEPAVGSVGWLSPWWTFSAAPAAVKHFDKVSGFMLELAYVRENLAAVEEMLRRRGMDPAAVLNGFRQMDEKRRALITQSESLKAQRNRA